MEIRSITLFCEPDFDARQASRFYTAVRDAFPYPLQSVRLATTPFPDWWEDGPSLAKTAATFAARWGEAGADYISLGPARLHHEDGWLERIPALLAATDVLFTTIEIGDTAGRIDVRRCRRAAGIIRRVSQLQANGFGNLYLAALANCPPGSPYFPVAYHGGGPATFAIAVQAADLARHAIQGANSLAEARRNLVGAIEKAAAAITAVADEVAAAHHIPCGGLDFSLAPYPSAGQSLAGALEDLGITAVGGPGGLFAAAFITEAIGRARFRRCGFSGLMLPVLEDAVLARRAAEGRVTLNDLLAYAAVCGVGLDTIPLPGDISEESLTAILLDVAALAARLDKPLTARLMPLPGLAAGDAVQFDFPYFADSGVMGLGAGQLSGPLAHGEVIDIHPR